MRAFLRYALIAGILAVALGEGVLRWGVGLGNPPLAKLDPVTEYELVREATYHRWGNEITINSHGMRASEHPARPEPGARHVLVLGDSVVYGGHFLDQNETIAVGLTEELIQEDGLSGCALRVLPMAVSSWGPVNQAAFLERDGTFGAEAAAIILSAHDLYDVPLEPADIVPYRQSPPLGAIGDAIEAVWERVFPPQNMSEPRPLEQRAEISLSALQRIADVFAARAIPLVLVYHPTTPELDDAARTERDVFAKWAAAQDVQFLDMTPKLKTSGYRDHIHPNAEGARAIAEYLAPELVPHVTRCAE